MSKVVGINSKDAQRQQEREKLRREIASNEKIVIGLQEQIRAAMRVGDALKRDLKCVGG